MCDIAPMIKMHIEKSPCSVLYYLSQQNPSHPSPIATLVGHMTHALRLDLWLTCFYPFLSTSLTEIKQFLRVPYSLAKLAICCYSLHSWLLVPGLSSHICQYFIYNLFLTSTLVSNILGNGYKIFQ